MTARYTNTAIFLHWLIAVLIIAGFVMGKMMVDMKFSPAKLQYFSWHKWIGLTVFFLALIRVFWRLTHQPPPSLPAPAWQRSVASVTHLMFYLLLVAIPLSGWLYSSAAGFKTVYLGLFPVPDLLDKDAGLKAALKSVHQALTFALAALVLLHLGAVLKHLLIDRDATLARMLPGKASRPARS